MRWAGTASTRALLPSLVLAAAQLLPAGTPAESSRPLPRSAPSEDPQPAQQTGDPGQGTDVLSEGTNVQGGPPPDLVIFFAGEVTGWTEPCG